MNEATAADILRKIDREQRSAGERCSRGDVVREHSPGGLECRIVYSHCAAEEIEEVIRDEVLLAESGPYALEWKVYDYDDPPNLGDCLLAAGFEPEPLESLMLLRLNDEVLAAFDASAYQIKRIHDSQDLNHVAEIAREIGRTDFEEEKQRLSSGLRNTPDELSIYVAYVDGEPVGCGRIHFKRNSDFAELAGGRTKTTYRNRGIFTALVAARLKEALARNCAHVLVDALPTSEPTLTKRGFQFVTHTRPFVYRPSVFWRSDRLSC